MAAASSTDDKKTKIGFLGLGIMGKAMAVNLVKAGFDVTVWNRTASKCDPLVALGATAASTPAEVVSSCVYTFGMLSDPEACLSVVFGDDGVLSAVGPGKSFVDMSTVDAATSQKIGEAVTAKGGRFLEAPVSGSKKPAEDGALIMLAAGDRALFDECAPHFDVVGKKSVYLGDVGQGAKMKLVVNMMLGTMTATFCEALGLSDKSGLKAEDVLDVLRYDELTHTHAHAHARTHARTLLLTRACTPLLPCLSFSLTLTRSARAPWRALGTRSRVTWW